VCALLQNWNKNVIKKELQQHSIKLTKMSLSPLTSMVLKGCGTSYSPSTLFFYDLRRRVPRITPPSLQASWKRGEVLRGAEAVGEDRGEHVTWMWGWQRWRSGCVVVFLLGRWYLIKSRLAFGGKPRDRRKRGRTTRGCHTKKSPLFSFFIVDWGRYV
jgi:hypothetical protein